MRHDELHIVKIPGADYPADIVTQIVPAELIIGHTKSLGIQLGSGRASTAPQLSSIVECPRESENDRWLSASEGVTRVHTSPRQELFTPIRVQGDTRDLVRNLSTRTPEQAESPLIRG